MRMAKLKILLVTLVSCLAATVAQSATAIKYTIKPVADTVMVTETTNLLTAVISNLTVTNTVVSDDGTTTNTVVTQNFTNLNITATWLATNSVSLLDGGAAPDAKANDATYSGNFIAPSTKVALNVTVTFSIKGTDLTSTNDSGESVQTPFSTSAKIAYKIYPRPVNDKFTNSFKIDPVGGTFTTYTTFDPANSLAISNNYAATESGEPIHGGGTVSAASVWWMWSSPTTTSVLIDLAGSSFKPLLSVYTGTALSNLVSVAAANSTKLPAYVQFAAEAGKTYRIAIASPDTNLTSQGTIRLRVAPGALPDTNGPTVKISFPKDGGVATAEQVTFVGTAAEPAGAQSGVSKVYLQVNGGTPVLAGSSSSWTKLLTLPAGTNAVTAYAMDYVGNYGPSNTISVIFMNPTNDLFSSSIEITDTAGELSAINGRATKEAGEPNHAGNEGGHSIWYHFQPPDNGVLTLSTSNSSFYTLLAVYTGDDVGNLTLVGANADAFQGSRYSYLQCYVTSNVVYHIAVDGYGGASGDVSLQYGFIAKAPESFYTLKITVPDGGTVTPTTGYYTAGSEVTLEAATQPNYVFYRWEGDLNSTNNPVTITMSGDKNVVARFRYLNYTEDFETGAFKADAGWSFAGDKKWTVQSAVAEGRYAASSGAISDNQNSQMTLVTKSMAGQASFDLRVSSEDPYDALKFYLNGALLKEWTGEVAWLTYFFDVKQGTNTLAWVYEKDNSFSGGLDAAFVDNISLPQGSLAATVSANRLSEDSVQIEVQGRLNQTYLIQASTDLIKWTTIATQKSAADGTIQFVDPNAAQYTSRYYRVVAP
jgi:hypothetical protein